MRATAVRVLCLSWLVWMVGGSQAHAQIARPFDRPSQNPAYSTFETRPTVSPYLNLVDNGGLSNYQALVRPLIEEREELNRQWTELDQVSRQVRGLPASSGRPEPGRRGSRGPSAVRFMHYSHYFGVR